MVTGIPYASVGGGNPTIQNQGLTSRNPEMAVAIPGVIDGASIPSDGVVLRGTILVWDGTSKKYHAYLHGTDDLATLRGQFVVAVDNIDVKAGIDKAFSGYFEGYFDAADLVDANAYNNLVIGDLALAGGFIPVPKLPGDSAVTEFRLIP